MQNKKRARFLLTSLQGGKRIGLRLALGAAITFSLIVCSPMGALALPYRRERDWSLGHRRLEQGRSR